MINAKYLTLTTTIKACNVYFFTANAPCRGVLDLEVAALQHIEAVEGITGAVQPSDIIVGIAFAPSLSTHHGSDLIVLAN